jgi:hypothetical protein
VSERRCRTVVAACLLAGCGMVAADAGSLNVTVMLEPAAGFVQAQGDEPYTIVIAPGSESLVDVWAAVETDTDILRVEFSTR